MAPAFRIAPAQRRHGPAILACLEQAFAGVRNQYTDGAWQDTVMTPEALESRFRSMVLFVALSLDSGGRMRSPKSLDFGGRMRSPKDTAARVVGTIGCQADGEGEGHLRGMAVLPDWHGSGVAQALLEAAEAELRARGCARITLDTTAPLQRAIRFYDRNGYRPTGRVADFYGMPLYEYAKV